MRKKSSVLYLLGLKNIVFFVNTMWVLWGYFEKNGIIFRRSKDNTILYTFKIKKFMFRNENYWIPIKKIKILPYEKMYR